MMLGRIKRTTLESGKSLSHVFVEAFVFLADAASVKCCTSPSLALTYLSMISSVERVIKRKI